MEHAVDVAGFTLSVAHGRRRRYMLSGVLALVAYAQGRSARRRAREVKRASWHAMAEAHRAKWSATTAGDLACRTVREWRRVTVELKEEKTRLVSE